MAAGRHSLAKQIAKQFFAQQNENKINSQVLVEAGWSIEHGAFILIILQLGNVLQESECLLLHVACEILSLLPVLKLQRQQLELLHLQEGLAVDWCFYQILPPFQYEKKTLEPGFWQEFMAPTQDCWKHGSACIRDIMQAIQQTKNLKTHHAHHRSRITNRASLTSCIFLTFSDLRGSWSIPVTAKQW